MCTTIQPLTAQMILIAVALILYHTALTAPQPESIDKDGDLEGNSKDFQLFASRRNIAFITISQKVNLVFFLPYVTLTCTLDYIMDPRHL